MEPTEKRICENQIEREGGDHNRLATNEVRQCPGERRQHDHAREADRLGEEGLVQRQMQLYARESRHVKQDDVERDGSEVTTPMHTSTCLTCVANVVPKLSFPTVAAPRASRNASV